MQRFLGVANCILLAAAVLSCTPVVTNSDPLHKIDHIVVIYQEDHSFDNLYGGWGEVGGQHVNGLSDATATTTTQVAQDGSPLTCLYQNDVNLASPSPLPTTCTDAAHPAKQGTTPAPQPVNSAFANRPWRIDDDIPATATTCSTASESDDNYADGTPGRVEHLADEQRFLRDAARPDGLAAVSFVKPIGAENEHPGYASEPAGSSHLVELIKAVVNGPNAKNTMVIVTYDEFGGQWDHVSPPGTPSNPGPHDVFGPGTRIPTLVLAPGLKPGVDRTQHDTTSILATIEHRFGLPPLTLPDGRPTRDAQVADLSTALH